MTLLQRKLSTLTFFGLSRSSSPASSRNARSPTPQSSRFNALAIKRRQSGLRYIFSHPRKHLAQSKLMTPPSSPTTTQPSLVISKLTKAFADSLNTTELSNFLVWILYFDTVELSGTLESWYNCIDNTDMQGWVALGKFPDKSRESGVEYGFDLNVMDSICDRNSLCRGTVHDLLIRFANPEQMKYATIASTITKAEEDGCSRIEVLETVQAKFHELNRLATSLHPQPGSAYEEQLTMVRKRVRGLLHLVIGPRIANLKLGRPLVTVATSDHVPKDIQECIRLNYLYEAIQQERMIPWHRYGSETGSVYSAPPTPSLSSRYGIDEETERARNHAINLMKQNNELRTLVAELQNDTSRLAVANEKLAREITAMGRMQPTGYVRSPSRSDDLTTELPCLSLDSVEQATVQTPLQRVRPRSLSASAVPSPSAPFDSESGSATYIRQHPETLASEYDDIFSKLESSPLPFLGLSDPCAAQSAS